VLRNSLYIFRYEGPLSEEGVLEKASNEGPRSIQYTQLVEWLTKEIKGFTGLEDYVSAINGTNNITSSYCLLLIYNIIKALFLS